MKTIIIITIAAFVLVGCGPEPSNSNSGVSELDIQLLKATKLDDPQVVEDLIKSGANVDTIWTGIKRHSALANWLYYGSFKSSEFENDNTERFFPSLSFKIETGGFTVEEYVVTK